MVSSQSNPVPADQQQQIIAQLANVLEGIISQRLLPRLDGQGRTLASEVMKVNYAMRACIRDRKLEQMVGLMEVGRQEGMHTIDDSLETLMQGGFISREEAMQQCRDLERFKPPEEEDEMPANQGFSQYRKIVLQYNIQYF